MKKILFVMGLLISTQLSATTYRVGECITEDKDYGAPPLYIKEIVAVGRDGVRVKLYFVELNGYSSLQHDLSWFDLKGYKKWACPNKKKGE
jgi:hypothetical protein